MFGARLNEIRKAKGYTAQQMADLLQMQIRGYRKYESGHTYPSYENLVRIADFLDVSLDYLLGRDEFIQAHAKPVDESGTDLPACPTPQ